LKSIAFQDWVFLYIHSIHSVVFCFVSNVQIFVAYFTETWVYLYALQPVTLRRLLLRYTD